MFIFDTESSLKTKRIRKVVLSTMFLSIPSVFSNYELRFDESLFVSVA